MRAPVPAILNFSQVPDDVALTGGILQAGKQKH
jgi:hypothetical protein